MKIRAFLLASSLISSSVFASTINFDYVEAGYAKLTLDGSELNPKGLGLKLSKALNDDLVLKANYIRTNDSVSFSETDNYGQIPVDVDIEIDTTLSQVYFGLGYLWHIDENKVFELTPYIGNLKSDIDSNINASVSFMGESFNESRTRNDSGDVNLFGLEANYHFAFNDTINMLLGLGYERLDYDYDPAEGKVFYQIQFNYNITKNFTLNFAHRNVKEYKNTGLNIRYNF